jgi:site-specific recombinase
MGILDYFKERWKAIVGGFTFGLVAGYGRGYVFGPQDLPFSARTVLAVQVALGFAALALFIVNYLELRQRVIKKASESAKDE